MSETEVCMGSCSCQEFQGTSLLGSFLASADGPQRLSLLTLWLPHCHPSLLSHGLPPLCLWVSASFSHCFHVHPSVVDLILVWWPSWRSCWQTRSHWQVSVAGQPRMPYKPLAKSLVSWSWDANSGDICPASLQIDLDTEPFWRLLESKLCTQGQKKTMQLIRLAFWMFLSQQDEKDKHCAFVLLDFIPHFYHEVASMPVYK